MYRYVDLSLFRSERPTTFTSSTPSNSQGPSVCENCQCLDCPGPCLPPLSRPPHCDSCGFRHCSTNTQCSSTPTSTTTPDITLTTDNIGTMFTELSPYSPLHTESSTTPTPTVDAVDAAIMAQTNFAADFDFEGDFFSYYNDIIDKANDLCYWLIFVLRMWVRLSLFQID